jgi:chemotaxis methyl-accepting protein methylase
MKNLAATNPQSSQDYIEKMAFQKVKQLIRENAGLDCSGYRDEYLKRRFEIRLRATATNTCSKYAIYLKRYPEEFSKLLNDLTINYTMFFRDIDVYNCLEKKILPKIFQLSNPTRIWSAGCATGEEPYSLSILVNKILGDSIVNHPVTIFASDIDKEALANAKKGRYHKKQIVNLNSFLVGKYFTKESDEYFVINEDVKKIVHFEQFDLMSEPVRLNLDLILCRNVMIYFSKEGQQHIHMNFYKVLKDKGYFFTGKSEILSGEPAQKFEAVDNSTRCYQKAHQTSVSFQFNSILPNSLVQWTK